MADKTVLVTGANRGIGRALVTESLERGAGQVIAGTRRTWDPEEDRVTPVMLDVTEPAQIAAVVRSVGAVDLLINNAGVMLPDVPLDRSVLEQHLAVNVFGSQAMTEAFLPALIHSGGAVVNLLSCVALAPLPGFASYAASKAAAFSLTKTYRAGYAAQGVRFHAVLAGPVDTEMTRELPIPKTSPQAVARAIFDAVEDGIEDIFPDPATAALATAWAAGADKILENQFAQLVPAPGA